MIRKLGQRHYLQKPRRHLRQTYKASGHQTSSLYLVSGLDISRLSGDEQTKMASLIALDDSKYAQGEQGLLQLITDLEQQIEKRVTRGAVIASTHEKYLRSGRNSRANTRFQRLLISWGRLCSERAESVMHSLVQANFVKYLNRSGLEALTSEIRTRTEEGLYTEAVMEAAWTYSGVHQDHLAEDYSRLLDSWG